MAMEQVGYVTEIAGDTVKIRVIRESACGGNCHGCKGCPTDSVFVNYPNDPAKPFVIGEEVRIMMPSKTFLRGTALSYGLMTFGLLSGAILGYLLSENEGISVLGALIGLLCGVLLMRITVGGKELQYIVQRHLDERE